MLYRNRHTVEWLNRPFGKGPSLLIRPGEKPLFNWRVESTGKRMIGRRLKPLDLTIT